MSDDKPSLLRRFDAAGRFVENTFLVGLLGAMMLLSIAQIIAREIFDAGLLWGPEIIRLMVLWLAMVGAVAACRENRHIRVDAISHLLAEKTVKIVRVAVDVFAAVVCAVIAWHSWRLVQDGIEFGETVLADTPAWMVHIIVPIAFALMGYRFLVGVGQSVAQLRAVDGEPDA